MKQPQRTVLYLRPHHFDTEQHIQLLQETCKRENHVVTAVYIDKGFSGIRLDRPELQRLLNDASERRFDVVRTHRLSQLTRRTVDFLYLYKTLKGHNVAIVANDVDTASPIGTFPVQMMAVMANCFPRMTRQITTAKPASPVLSVPQEYINDRIVTVIRESDSGEVRDGGHS